MDEYDQRWQRRFDATQRRLELKKRAIAYLGGKCCIPNCGYDDPVALEFHHQDPDEKDFDISSKMSWEGIQAELDKCLLVCANHHREIHAGYYPSLLVLEDEDRSPVDTLPTEWNWEEYSSPPTPPGGREPDDT